MEEVEETKPDEETSEELTLLEEELNDDVDTTVQEDHAARQELVATYKEALEEKTRLLTENKILQSNLSLYFKKIQFKAPEEIIDIPLSEQQKNYDKTLDEIESLLHETDKFTEEFTLEMAKCEKHFLEKVSEVKDATNQLYQLRKNVALRSVNSATGEKLPKETVEWYLTKLAQAEDKKHQIHLKYIKELKALQRTEERSEALKTDKFTMTLNDYELLVCECNIRNARCMEKKKEVKKLYNSCSEAVNVLSHLKHKLHFLRKDKQDTRARIRELQEENDALTRELLTLKERHEGTTMKESRELHEKFAMIQDDLLPNDFFQKSMLNKQLTIELSELQEKYAQLMASVNKRKK